MGLFRAIGRYIRAIGYLLVGNVDKATASLNLNPTVMNASYDQIIKDKTSRLATYKDAIGGLVAQREAKKEKLKVMTAEIEKHEKLKAGAMAMARKLAEKYAGDQAKCAADAEFVKCQAAFRDFSTTLEEKEKSAKELEADANRLGETINSHKIQIQGLLRDLDKLKDEKHEAVAEVISATEEKNIADTLNGLAQDKTNEELVALRELRGRAKANAQVSRELSGLDTRKQEAEFLSAVETSTANNEFNDMIFGKKETTAPVKETVTSAIPEA